MDTIKLNDTGAAVQDVQRRLASIGLLPETKVNGVFGQETANAVRAFRARTGLPLEAEVDEKTWSALVDASFRLGDRTLYLRMPYFHGNDVLELQRALGALGFSCGTEDGIFGAYTEDSVRKFQQNMGLPTDGIVGAFTFGAIRNLHHSWEGKKPVNTQVNLGFARAADVLERHALCLFGTDPFTRQVASRMSNLSLATNPASKILSADSLLVAPSQSMLLVHIELPAEDAACEGARADRGAGADGGAGAGGKAQAHAPRVSYAPDGSLALRLTQAIQVAWRRTPSRLAVTLPGATWEDAGEERSAQHYAITLLDALCTALAELDA